MAKRNRRAGPAGPVGTEEARALYRVNLPGGRKSRKGGGPRRLIQILNIIAGLLVLIILAGTLYAVIRRPPAPLPGADPESAGGVQDPGNAVFTGIGRLRIPAGGGSGADSSPQAVVILSVVFPYSPEDRPFTEELAGKIPLFRRIIGDYFGALSREELNPLDEQGAKEELLRRFNRELRLGSIESLLFADLMILE